MAGERAEIQSYANHVGQAIKHKTTASSRSLLTLDFSSLEFLEVIREHVRDSTPRFPLF